MTVNEMNRHVKREELIRRVIWGVLLAGVAGLAFVVMLVVEVFG